MSYLLVTSLFFLPIFSKTYVLLHRNQWVNIGNKTPSWKKTKQNHPDPLFSLLLLSNSSKEIKTLWKMIKNQKIKFSVRARKTSGGMKICKGNTTQQKWDIGDH